MMRRAKSMLESGFAFRFPGSYEQQSSPGVAHEQQETDVGYSPRTSADIIPDVSEDLGLTRMLVNYCANTKVLTSSPYSI